MEIIKTQISDTLWAKKTVDLDGELELLTVIEDSGWVNKEEAIKLINHLINVFNIEEEEIK